MTLKNFIDNRSARVAVMGLGYVGLPLLVDFAAAGFQVLGFDPQPGKLVQLKKGFDPSMQKNDRRLKKLLAEGKIKLSSDPRILKQAQVIIICVPTPLSRHREPDMSFIRSAVDMIKNNFVKGQMVILESTSYPGTTEEELKPVLEQNGRYLVGRDFFLAFSPERIDPGNSNFKLNEIPKVVGGMTPLCTALGEALYRTIFKEVYPASSPRVAEMEKLLENIFRSVNIALVNELAILSRKMKIDIWEVIQLASTKPYGFMPFYPGPGLGGHCIPVDPFYLTWKARELDFATRFIELAGETNTQMPYYVISLLAEALAQDKKSIRGSRLLILGVTYKKDVPDTRESPAFKIIELLEKAGARVAYHDPLVNNIVVAGKKYVSTPLDRLVDFDGAVLVTNHSSFNLKIIARSAKTLVDTRGATRGLKNFRKIIRL